MIGGGQFSPESALWTGKRFSVPESRQYVTYEVRQGTEAKRHWDTRRH